MNESIWVLEAFVHYFQERAHLDRVEIVHVPWEIRIDTTSDNLLPFHVIQGPSSADGAWSQIHS